MKILLICAAVCSLVALSLAGPVKTKVKDNTVDNISSSSSESIEKEKLVINASENDAKEESSSEEENENDEDTQSILKDESSDSSEEEQEKSKAQRDLLVVDDNMDFDRSGHATRRRRSIPTEANTDNHIQNEESAYILYTQHLKAKRGKDKDVQFIVVRGKRHADSKSSEENSSEEHKKHGHVLIAKKPNEAPTEKIELAAKPDVAPTEKIELAAKPDEAPAEEIELAAKPDEAPAEEIELAAKPDEAPAEEVKAEGAAASRRRRATVLANSGAEDEHSNCNCRGKRNAKSSEEHSSEEKGNIVIAKKPAVALTEEIVLATKPNEAPEEELKASRRRRNADWRDFYEVEKPDDYSDIIAEFNVEEGLKQKYQEDNGKYFILNDVKVTNKYSIDMKPKQDTFMNEHNEIKSKSTLFSNDISDEDYAKGCEGNDAINNTEEWNDTIYNESFL